jgi:hypothetical protein
MSDRHYVNDWGVTVYAYQTELGGVYHSEEAAMSAAPEGAIQALVRFADVYHDVVRARATDDLERELAAAKAWKDAVIDAAVVGWTYCAADEDDPRACLSRIMAMNSQIALDPAVSSEAAALIERGRQEVREELAAAKADAERLREFAQWLIDSYLSEDGMPPDKDVVREAHAALAKEKAS